MPGTLCIEIEKTIMGPQSSRQTSPANGHSLYGENCDPCHGIQWTSKLSMGLAISFSLISALYQYTQPQGFAFPGLKGRWGKMVL